MWMRNSGVPANAAGGGAANAGDDAASDVANASATTIGAARRPMNVGRVVMESLPFLLGLLFGFDAYLSKASARDHACFPVCCEAARP